MLSSTQIIITVEIKMYGKLYCLDVQGANVNTDKTDIIIIDTSSHTHKHKQTKGYEIWIARE